MSEQNQNLPVCANGHQQPSAGSRFCIYCGTPLVAAAPVPGANIPQVPQPPPSQQQAPQPPIVSPVNQGYRQYPNSQPPQYNPVPPQQQAPAPPPAVPQINQGQPNIQQPVYNPVPPQQQYPQYQQFQQPYPQYQPVPAVICATCGGQGQGLPDRSVVCKECGWLRPLVPGYQIDNSAFAWAADAKAMAVLQGMKPLSAAAKLVSEKVGRRWVEAAFNGVLLGEKQLPQIYGQAVRAARILGMSHMPDVYLSGDRAWDCLTFGTNRDYFVVIGSALAGNFQGVDMLFMLAREMGHCKAGHALWKTVIRFFLGEQGPAKGLWPAVFLMRS